MSETRKVSLIQYDLTREGFRSLPEEHQAVLAVLSYAVSEINALQRLFVAQELKMTDFDAVNSAIKIQYFVVLRTWSSKLFEVIDFFDKVFFGKKPEVKDNILLGLASAAAEKINSIRSGAGYDTARDIRNEAAYHYSFKAAKGNLSHVRDQADCRLYTHVHGGNDFYPLGEEVMFQARLERKWKALPSINERNGAFLSWLEWNQKSTHVLGEVCAYFFDKLVFSVVPEIGWSEGAYEIPSSLVGDPKRRKTPVFVEFLEP